MIKAIDLTYLDHEELPGFSFGVYVKDYGDDAGLFITAYDVDIVGEPQQVRIVTEIRRSDVARLRDFLNDVLEGNDD